MDSLEDTIVAVATPPGAGARAVLRLSGPEAFDCLAALAGSPIPEVRGYSGRVVRLQLQGVTFRAWAALFRRPRSYTREDMVEIHLPSSPPLLSGVARRCTSRNAVRWAWPGEFTLRALRNGRIDLTQAEAVAQLISAASEEEARAARRGLEGELRQAVGAVADSLAESLALLEAALDFADEDLPEVSTGDLRGRLAARLGTAREALRRLHGSTRLRLVPAGAFHVVLAGLANAGKSSLLNAVLGRPAALVSPRAGTTRDPVGGVVRSGDLRVAWTDVAGTLAGSLDLGAGPTAGPAGGEDADPEAALAPHTREAIRRLTALELERADLVLWVVDPRDRAELSLAHCRALAAKRKWLVVNKIDLLSGAERSEWAGGGALSRAGVVLLVSALSGEGVPALKDRVSSEARRGRSRARRPVEPARYLASAHQEAALERAEEALERAVAALEGDLGLEYAAADLRDGLVALEELCGKVTPDEILGRIFARFCVGK